MKLFLRYLNDRSRRERIRKDYPTTGVLKLFRGGSDHGFPVTDHQEGLPDYWGIETLPQQTIDLWYVLDVEVDQEGLPDYWGIETCLESGVQILLLQHQNQEGLPDYWGIETSTVVEYPPSHLSYQEGLPDYWGIETYEVRPP